jgi:hypothetical protein
MSATWELEAIQGFHKVGERRRPTSGGVCWEPKWASPIGCDRWDSAGWNWWRINGSNQTVRVLSLCWLPYYP